MCVCRVGLRFFVWLALIQPSYIMIGVGGGAAISASSNHANAELLFGWMGQNRSRRFQSNWAPPKIQCFAPCTQPTTVGRGLVHAVAESSEENNYVFYRMLCVCGVYADANNNKSGNRNEQMNSCAARTCVSRSSYFSSCTLYLEGNVWRKSTASTGLHTTFVVWIHIRYMGARNSHPVVYMITSHRVPSVIRRQAVIHHNSEMRKYVVPVVSAEKQAKHKKKKWAPSFPVPTAPDWIQTSTAPHTTHTGRSIVAVQRINNI